MIPYGHDPHTHYYLGVTHEAYADKTFQANRMYTEEIAYHLNQSVHYLTLRATATYRDEFLEERWGVMLMLGGSIPYSTLTVKKNLSIVLTLLFPSD